MYIGNLSTGKLHKHLSEILCNITIDTINELLERGTSVGSPSSSKNAQTLPCKFVHYAEIYKILFLCNVTKFFGKVCAICTNLFFSMSSKHYWIFVISYCKCDFSLWIFDCNIFKIGQSVKQCLNGRNFFIIKRFWFWLFSFLAICFFISAALLCIVFYC